MARKGRALLLFGHARSIERMFRIERETVSANVCTIASLVGRPLALMTIPAQRAQGPEHERVVIAAMPWVMIRDRRRRQAAARFT